VRIKNAVIYEKRRATDADPDLIASIDDRLRTVTRHLLDARDAVRKRLAADLHDGLGQTLGMLRLEIESAVARLSPGDDTAVLDLAVERVKQAQKELRQYTKRFYSLTTDASGLMDSLQALAADFRSANCDIELTVDLKGFRRDVPAELSVAIYRIVQESLNNIIHHSLARNASLFLQSDKKTGVQLVVSDDGVGLPTSGPAHRGLGLITMRERAKRLGGHYETDCPNNEGCTIRVSWRPELVASLR
jgi:signal transduction histidine kinase